jgi:hypothetical protein
MIISEMTSQVDATVFGQEGYSSLIPTRETHDNDAKCISQKIEWIGLKFSHLDFYIFSPAGIDTDSLLGRDSLLFPFLIGPIMYLFS